MIELLSPAGNLDKLKFALHYGADAVYAGGPLFSMRARADNFSIEDIKTGIDYAHSLGKKFYLAVNVFFRNDMFKDLDVFLEKIIPLGPDALIIGDPGVVARVRKQYPSMDIHLSTQASVMNSDAVAFYRDQGVKRIVLSRELSMEEVASIRAAVTDVELEVFVHGAMCVAYSGRCLMSNYLTDKAFLGKEEVMPPNVKNPRIANNGDCSQSCRWHYSLVEEQRDHLAFHAEENEAGTMLFASKDLCMIQHMKELQDAGIDSIKIEGRMKSILYIANTARIYRHALEHLDDAEIYRDDWQKELDEISRREYTTGFYFPDNRSLQYTHWSPYGGFKYMGYVLSREGNRVRCRASNKIVPDDPLESIGPSFENIECFNFNLYDGEGEEKEFISHSCEFILETDAPLKPMDILRVKLTHEQ